VALNLLFHIPLQWAIIITAFDVLLLLALQGMGMRMLEAVVTVFVMTIGFCYGIEIFVLPHMRPDFLEMGRALTHPSFRKSVRVDAARVRARSREEAARLWKRMA